MRKILNFDRAKEINSRDEIFDLKIRFFISATPWTYLYKLKRWKFVRLLLRNIFQKKISSGSGKKFMATRVIWKFTTLCGVQHREYLIFFSQDSLYGMLKNSFSCWICLSLEDRQLCFNRKYFRWKLLKKHFSMWNFNAKIQFHKYLIH